MKVVQRQRNLSDISISVASNKDILCTDVICSLFILVSKTNLG
jgi:hypothetical protein